MTAPLSNRRLKAELQTLLLNDDFEAMLAAVRSMPPKKVVSPLFSFFCSGEPLLYWRSISAMGAVVSRMANDDPEAARVVMRRLMWQLNEESGGIGWGCPEAMGDIMACDDRMAREYACILISYINPCGSLIDHPILQQGVLWGLGRLAHARSDRATAVLDFLSPFLSDANPVIRGLSAWVAGAFPDSAIKPLRIRLSDDNEQIPFYISGSLCSRTVGSLAR